MNPLIDQELESVDRKHMDLTVLNGKLVDAFEMYHKLMKEAPVYGYSLKNTNMMTGAQQYPQGMPAQGMPGYAEQPVSISSILPGNHRFFVIIVWFGQRKLNSQ